MSYKLHHETETAKQVSYQICTHMLIPVVCFIVAPCHVAQQEQLI